MPWRVVLLRSDSALAVLREFEAFPSGLAFSLVTHLKEDPPEREGRLGRHAPFFAWGEGMRIGVAFADGRKAVAGGHMGLQPSGDPSQPVLRAGGGSGSGSLYRLSFWLWPLPPPGPLTWAGQWLDGDLPENLIEVDATVLDAAASEAEQLWEVDPNEASRSLSSSVAMKRGASEPPSESGRT